jgi:hypothetical protein
MGPEVMVALRCPVACVLQRLLQHAVQLARANARLPLPCSTDQLNHGGVLLVLLALTRQTFVIRLRGSSPAVPELTDAL